MPLNLRELIHRGENSPFYKLLNMIIEEVGNNYSRLSINIEKKHIQFLQTVHGGVMASLADSAAAWAIYGSNNLEDKPVTVEMKINYLKPVRSGTLIAEARIIHEGSRIFVSEVEIKNSEGFLVAKSLVTYYLLKSRANSN